MSTCSAGRCCFDANPGQDYCDIHERQRKSVPCPVRSCLYNAHACRNRAHRTWWRRALLRLAGGR